MTTKYTVNWVTKNSECYLSYISAYDLEDAGNMVLRQLSSETFIKVESLEGSASFVRSSFITSVDILKEDEAPKKLKVLKFKENE